MGHFCPIYHLYININILYRNSALSKGTVATLLLWLDPLASIVGQHCPIV